MIENAILKNVEKLPESVKQSVLDYTEFLVNRYTTAPAKTPQRGGLGIWQGQIWMSDDFDEPLEDLKDYM
ncbi:DUF2281 domain-containing protein [Laspinema sp. A4]|uniref:type II toxin-antitoxin system VapB family antitoxin n=1 Tax=Laspinema sp. D2d TaxID=2953686 RepID=UPI0021BBA274|nr:DUF2281 domain-containing protein [Laspinema sp. D2d]MCT7985419.1 DUF2281 domain-containing protein [Laspinema sp. D2d]